MKESALPSVPPSKPSSLFERLDHTRYFTERVIRVAQASFGIAAFLGYNRVIPFTKNVNFTKMASLIGDARMCIFAFELPFSLTRLKKGQLIGECWKESKDLDELARQFAFTGACLTLDTALLASFWGNQLPRIASAFTGQTLNLPKFPAADFFGRSLTPSLTMVYATGLMKNWETLSTKHDYPSRLKMAKSATDLGQTLFPLLFSTTTLGAAQKDFLNLGTGLIGSYVLWETFPKTA